MATTEVVYPRDAIPLFSRISWGALLAGLFVTLAVFVLLSTLGVAIGISSADAAGRERIAFESDGSTVRSYPWMPVNGFSPRERAQRRFSRSSSLTGRGRYPVAFRAPSVVVRGRSSRMPPPRLRTFRRPPQGKVV